MPNTLASELRWVKDIGMYALDRPREVSCVHATSHCAATCFNNNLERMYKDMLVKDVRNEAAWRDNNADGLAVSLSRRKHQTTRVRLMSRGEAFSDYSDIERVAAILRATPNSVWWIPTRAWRSPLLWLAVIDAMSRFPNVRILASVDPSNEADEMSDLETAGFSTMFYGDDEALVTPNGTRRFKCPKTWKHLKGHCAICKAGCFRNDKPVHVHLKQH